MDKTRGHWKKTRFFKDLKKKTLDSLIQLLNDILARNAGFLWGSPRDNF